MTIIYQETVTYYAHSSSSFGNYVIRLTFVVLVIYFPLTEAALL